MAGSQVAQDSTVWISLLCFPKMMHRNKGAHETAPQDSTPENCPGSSLGRWHTCSARHETEGTYQHTRWLERAAKLQPSSLKSILMQGLCLELGLASALTLSHDVSSSFNNYFVFYFTITVMIIDKWLRPGTAPLLVLSHCCACACDLGSDSPPNRWACLLSDIPPGTVLVWV